MNPAWIDAMSWEMAEVYGAVTDQIMINLARYFPFYNSVDELPRSAFEYQAKMLAQMGQVNRETVRIIRNNLKDADSALKGCLEGAIIESIRKTEPALYNAVKKGIFALPTTPVVSPNQMRAFQLYYKQAADKLNLVNTVMLESTGSAYRQAVTDVVSSVELADKMNRTQIALDVGAGETITGVSSWNQAVKHSIDKMKDGGITGFIDHGGHRWSAEAYTAMDIRTTLANTARAAVWETNQNFGNDLYLVSSHNGARPLCYPWQNKVISSMDAARDTVDLYGNPVHVYAQSETSYGQPAGLFGINCGHMANPFIPGVSTINGEPQNEEENAKAYAESQEQRRLERKLREEKRDLAIAKAQGASDEEIKRLRDKCRSTSYDIDDFCDKTGRARHRDREAVYTQREFPEQKKYDVTKFETEQKERISEFYEKGGAQKQFTFGQMIPNIPLVPKAPEPEPTQQNTLQNEANEQQSNGEEFTPATTRAEAEQYAKDHFTETATYNGSMTVEMMNTVNSEMKDLTETYPVEKLRSVTQNGRINALAQANGGRLEINAKKIGESFTPYSQRQKYAAERIAGLEKRFPEGIPSAYRKDYRKFQEILKFSRWTVDDELDDWAAKIRATLDHEYGHILADQRCGQINGRRYCPTYGMKETNDKIVLINDTFRKAKETGDIYKLSEYGATNSHEFFAEAFSAFRMKEELPDYFVAMIEGVVN